VQSSVGEVRELPEDDDVHERGERGYEDRPRDPEERLLVAHDHVAPDERPEELAEVPELGDVEARPLGCGPDDGDAARAVRRGCGAHLFARKLLVERGPRFRPLVERASHPDDASGRG
jgi:hypothetical protein